MSIANFTRRFQQPIFIGAKPQKKHRRISDEDAYLDAPCKVADRKTEPSNSEKPNNCEPQTEECEEPNYYDPALWE